MDKTEQEKKDIRIDCVGIPGDPCDNQFIWTVGEQQYYEKKGLYPPKRCPNCRIKMKKYLKERRDNE